MSTLFWGRRAVTLFLIALVGVAVLVGSSYTSRAAGEDLSISMTDAPDPVAANADITYTITITNNSDTAATGVRWDDIIPLNTNFRSVGGTAGWDCTTPSVGGIGTVTCLNGSVPANNSVQFTLVIRVNDGTLGNTVIENSALVVYATDPNEANNDTGIIETLVNQTADISVQMTASPNPVVASTQLTYTITVRNIGPEDATNIQLDTAVPANVTFASLTKPGTWSCSTPSVGAAGAIQCTAATLVVNVNQVFVLKVDVPALPGGDTITNLASVTATSYDPSALNNNTGNVETTVKSTADLGVTIAGAPSPKVSGGENLVYTVVVSNSPAYEVGTDVSWSIDTPAGTTYRDIVAASGWTCLTPGIGGTGTITCSRSRVPVNTNHSFDVTVRIDTNAVGGAQVGNTTSLSTTSEDPNPDNDTGTVSITVTPPTLATTPTIPFNVTYRNMINDRYTQTINVTNSGESGSILNLRVVSNTSPFTVTGLPLSVKEGDPAKSFTLNCNPAAGAVLSGSLVLATNELNAPTYTFNLTCGPVRQGVGVYRPSNGRFYMRVDLTVGGYTNTVTGGLPGDLPVIGDWNGDGIETAGLWRPSTRVFYLRDSNSPAVTTWDYYFAYGNSSNAIPLVGDWDGDGRDGVGVYNLGTSQFLLRNSLTTGFANYNQYFGEGTDIGLAGDWNGDGIDTIGVYKAGSTFIFFLTNETCGKCTPRSQGRANFTPTYASDKPIVGDWNGDGRTTFGLFRQAEGRFFLSDLVQVNIPATVGFLFGTNVDSPIVGRWVAEMQSPLTPPAPSFVPR